MAIRTRAGLGARTGERDGRPRAREASASPP